MLANEIDDVRLSLQQIRYSIKSMSKRRVYILLADYPHLEELDEQLLKLRSRLDASSEELILAQRVPAVAAEAGGNGFARNGENAAEYDVNAAAEVFAAIFHDQRPRDVLREHGFDDVDFDSSDLSTFEGKNRANWYNY